MDDRRAQHVDKFEDCENKEVFSSGFVNLDCMNLSILVYENKNIVKA